MVSIPLEVTLTRVVQCFEAWFYYGASDDLSFGARESYVVDSLKLLLPVFLSSMHESEGLAEEMCVMVRPKSRGLLLSFVIEQRLK